MDVSSRIRWSLHALLVGRRNSLLCIVESKLWKMQIATMAWCSLIVVLSCIHCSMDNRQILPFIVESSNTSTALSGGQLTRTSAL